MVDQAFQLRQVLYRRERDSTQSEEQKFLLDLLLLDSKVEISKKSTSAFDEHTLREFRARLLQETVVERTPLKNHDQYWKRISELSRFIPDSDSIVIPKAQTERAEVRELEREAPAIPNRSEVRALFNFIVNDAELTNEEVQQFAGKVVNYAKIYGTGVLERSLVDEAKSVPASVLASYTLDDAKAAQPLYGILLEAEGVVRFELFEALFEDETFIRGLIGLAFGLAVLNSKLSIEFTGPEAYRKKFNQILHEVHKEKYENAGKKIRPGAIQPYPRYPTGSPTVVISGQMDQGSTSRNFNPRVDSHEIPVKLTSDNINAMLATGVSLLGREIPDGVTQIKEQYRWQDTQSSIRVFIALSSFIQAAAAKAIERAA